jgi:hypothetical protein
LTIRRSAGFGVALAVLALAGPALGQLPCPDWACFVDETSTRLVLTSDTAGYPGSPDQLDDDSNDEMDMDCGDVDLDGDADCVLVYKQLGTTTGKRRNWLFLNENGVMVDRTGEYGSASNVGGDLGLMTPTNNRDVLIMDLTGDDWPEIVTATTLSGTTGGGIGTKSMSHPRIYLNLGEDGGGNWLGFIYDDVNRVPTMPSEPRFCAVSGGDIDNDGDNDLYFGDYQQGPYTRPVDLNDRLWINNGSGYFTDESAARMTAQMLESSFGMATSIADMNGDGRLDIVKDDALNAPQAISVSYNNLLGAGTTGIFNGYQLAYEFTPYHVSTPDLNGDGKLDIIASDDAQSYFKLNNGNLASGQVAWLPSATGRYTMGGSPSQFDSDNGCADFDNDGWPDCWVTNVDVDLPDCSDRGHIFHNSGAPAPGGIITLNFQGNLGISLSAYTGSHDGRAVDINGDGWLDWFTGSCTGTFIFMNQPPFGIEVDYPNGRPNLIEPDTATPFEVEITAVGGTPVSRNLRVSTNGGSYATVGLTSLGGNLYEAVLPSSPCMSSLSYYIEVEFTGGTFFRDPPNAPVSTYGAIAALHEITYEETVESDTSEWTVVNDPALTTGAWEAADPIGTLSGGNVASPFDPAEGTMAFITDNCNAAGCGVSDADIDGGGTNLISETFDLAGGDADFSYYLWFFATGTGGTDNLTVAVTNQAGAGNPTWVTVATVTGTGGQWQLSGFRVSDFVTPTSEVAVRFRAVDGGTATNVEAGMDHFKLDRLGCDECDFMACDDGNPCTTDSCQVGTGCVATNNSAGCDDGNACTVGDSCSGGSCVAGSGQLDCNDSNVCTSDSCNPGSGCVNANNNNACDDANPCTHSDACSAGSCGGTAVTCSGGDQCNDAACDTNGAQGNCDLLLPVANGTSCDDGDPCNLGEACQGGACLGGAAGDCSGSGDDCNIASCSAGGAEGNCDDLQPANEGGPCNNNLGACQGGTCVMMGCGSVADCADTDQNGVRDDACTWWACNAGTCAGTAIGFADLGGAFGACPPDAATDGNDRFHALNCFSNQDTSGIPGQNYPCEDNPPLAYNVDAGGPFGDCDPDGVCDGNDAFHALNVFTGTSACSCGGPAPTGPSAPQIVGSVRLQAVASDDVILPGGLVEVDVVLDSPLKDLRGYQLHVSATGGTRGRLELQDILVRPQSGFVFESLGSWQAFNVETAPMVAGLDQNGVATARGGYLATFVFRASADAAGQFSVGLLHDSQDPSQRTFVFPTLATGKIEVVAAELAIIDVQAAGKRLGRR